ncbi:MAG: L,D-transpeptidase family protein [Cyanobacteria bacterium J06598_3]
MLKPTRVISAIAATSVGLAAGGWAVGGLFAPAAIATAIESAIESAIELPEDSVIAQSPASQTLSAVSTDAADALVLNLVLSLSDRRVSVYRGDMLVASYAVAVGREGWQTPTGEFTVFQKQIDPAWEHPFTGEVLPPGPDNPLGSRWIGFWSDGTNSIGFHGTPDESVIGSAVSHGCVRMRNEDVLALYEQVGLDTRVRVLP